MGSEFQSLIRELVKRQDERCISLIEQACAEANEMMDRGVLVYHLGGVPIMVEPHVSVPYREIHFRPSPFDPM